jgi:stage III sporulation protein AA
VDKARAVQMALRTLAPQVILLDELGSLEETMALEQGFFSGVDFIASIHAPDAAQAQRRPQVQALLQRGMLRQLVILAGRETPGCIREVCAV